MCERSGGVLGTKQAFLKKDGMIVEFKTLEDAKKVASNLMISMNQQNNTVARFSYWVVEVPDEKVIIN
jgi:hypothetical protein